MPHLELQNNCDNFLKLIKEYSISEDKNSNFLHQNYIRQNIALLNDILLVSLNHLKKLQEVNSANDVICTQARFSNEINKKISFMSQNFLTNSLRNVTTDYDEWLRAHCDLATD
ncbi:MAG: hypothetical protein KIT56_08830 [Gammaproteobacteria bacterium]|nr:hypothetical protein [Gammaproteobacteria bacterium]MCW5583960.1 hypothetical protein [Gammaproteobacteria bacterium]